MRLLPLLALACAMPLCTTPSVAGPQSALPSGCPALAKRETLYRVCEDQGALLAAARDAARREGKMVLAVFGATWCPSCKVLHKQMGTLMASPIGGDRGRTVGAAFHTVEIATSTLNGARREEVASGRAALDAAVARAGGVKVRGVPFLVVMDPVEGGKAAARNLDDVEGQDGFETASIASFLAQAERHIRHGEPQPTEPGWLMRKLTKLWRRL